MLRRYSTIVDSHEFVFDEQGAYWLDLALFKRKVSTMLDVTEIAAVVPVDAETLSENVFRRIQAAIVKGEIAPGSKISEPELARTYGISRGPLREAIHRLEGQRLLVRVPHVGARVVSLSHAELVELYSPARRLILLSRASGRSMGCSWASSMAR